MVNIQQLQQLLGGANSQQLLGKMMQGMASKNFAGGILAGGLAQAVLGKGDGLAKSALKMGGLAILSNLAVNAVQQYRQNPQAGINVAGQNLGGVLDQIKGAFAGVLQQGQGALQGVLPAANNSTEGGDALAIAMISAMIAAAKADGNIDMAENGAIFGQMEQAGLTSDEKSALLQALNQPTNLHDIASAVSSQEQAAQVYAAALTVVADNNPAEQLFLQQLAQSLNLDAGLVATLHGHVQAIQQAA
jgi:uncharacterized membrane protein YebE (DUF533 family)